MHTRKGDNEPACVHRLIAIWIIDTACMPDESIADDHMAALCRLQKDVKIEQITCFEQFESTVSFTR